MVVTRFHPSWSWSINLFSSTLGWSDRGSKWYNLSIGWYRLEYRWVLPISFKNMRKQGSSMHERCERHPKRKKERKKESEALSETDGLCSSEHGLWGIGFGGSPIGYAGFMSCFKVQGNFLLLCSSNNFVGYSGGSSDSSRFNGWTVVSHSKELWGEKDGLFFSKRELHHYNRKPNAIVYTCIYFLGERGHWTLNHIEVVHYTFIHDLNNVASKTKHESKIVCYLKSEIKHPPCSAGPDFDYSSRVSRQCWHLHSCKALWSFPSNSFSTKRKHVLNWESEDGSVFIDLNLFFVAHVNLLVA